MMQISETWDHDLIKAHDVDVRLSNIIQNLKVLTELNPQYSWAGNEVGDIVSSNMVSYMLFFNRSDKTAEIKVFEVSKRPTDGGFEYVFTIDTSIDEIRETSRDVISVIGKIKWTEDRSLIPGHLIFESVASKTFSASIKELLWVFREESTNDPVKDLANWYYKVGYIHRSDGSKLEEPVDIKRWIWDRIIESGNLNDLKDLITEDGVRVLIDKLYESFKSSVIPISDIERRIPGSRNILLEGMKPSRALGYAIWDDYLVLDGKKTARVSEKKLGSKVGGVDEILNNIERKKGFFKNYMRRLQGEETKQKLGGIDEILNNIETPGEFFKNYMRRLQEDEMKPMERFFSSNIIKYYRRLREIELQKNERGVGISLFIILSILGGILALTSVGTYLLSSSEGGLYFSLIVMYFVVYIVEHMNKTFSKVVLYKREMELSAIIILLWSNVYIIVHYGLLEKNIEALWENIHLSLIMLGLLEFVSYKFLKKPLIYTRAETSLKIVPISAPAFIVLLVPEAIGALNFREIAPPVWWISFSLLVLIVELSFWIQKEKEVDKVFDKVQHIVRAINYGKDIDGRTVLVSAYNSKTVSIFYTPEEKRKIKDYRTALGGGLFGPIWGLGFKKDKMGKKEKEVERWGNGDWTIEFRKVEDLSDLIPEEPQPDDVANSGIESTKPIVSEEKHSHVELKTDKKASDDLKKGAPEERWFKLLSRPDTFLKMLIILGSKAKVLLNSEGAGINDHDLASWDSLFGHEDVDKVKRSLFSMIDNLRKHSNSKDFKILLYAFSPASGDEEKKALKALSRLSYISLYRSTFDIERRGPVYYHDSSIVYEFLRVLGGEDVVILDDDFRYFEKPLAIYNSLNEFANKDFPSIETKNMGDETLLRLSSNDISTTRSIS